MDLILRALGAISHAAIAIVVILLLTVATESLTGDQAATNMVPSILFPAWLSLELIRWVNRRHDPQHAKRPPDPP